MEQADSEKMDRKSGSAPRFLRRVEAAELKDVEESPAPELQQVEVLGRGGAGGESEARAKRQEKESVVPETAPKAAVMPGAGLAAGIVTRLTPSPLMSDDLLTDPEALTARQKSRIVRERAGPLLETRYIVLMLVLGIAVGAVIGTMVAMSLFP